VKPVSKSEEKAVFLKTLEAVLENLSSEPDSYDLIAFSNLKGRKWSHNLMVVGRFMNGYDEHRPLKEIRDPATWDKYHHDVFRTRFHEAHCPVTAFHDEVARSQFWDTVREVARGLGLDEDWASRIAYSNLYKFGPNRGNPHASLCRAQRPGCLRLLDLEIAQLAPRRILFLTGWNWAEKFLGPEGIAFDVMEPCRGDVDRAGIIPASSSPIHTVVSKHPQGKQRAPLVEEILRAFKCLEDRTK
jgi:hypothetical protein